MNQIDIMRLLARVFYVFPIKRNRVILTAYNGRQYGCSPKYITERLSEEKNKFEVYYALDKKIETQLPQGVKRIDYKSFKHFYLLMTSKFIIFNSTGFSCMLPYRKNQIIINTWHGGGAFKKTGISSFNSEKDLKKRRISGNNTSYFISSSKVFGDNQCYSMCLSEGKMLNIGTPRNDILFNDNPELTTKVHNFFRLNNKCGLILYAPTYRDNKKKAINDYSFEPLDIQRVLEAAKDRFGKNYVFLYRAHHDMIPENLADNCLNATEYPDMQELLVAADILITDYSSAMWDFALTKKLGFLYVPDEKEYEASNQLGSPVSSWPYPAAQSNTELVDLIKSFSNDKNIKKIDDYFSRLGSYEKGDATERLIQLMRSKIE